MTVDVVLDGRIVESSEPAVLDGGIVMAPVNPFARRLADRIEVDMERRTIRFERGDRTITVPIAPYVRENQIVIPLAMVARSLGVTVRYDGEKRLISLLSPPAKPVATMMPFTPVSPLPQPRPTFTPEEIPTPKPTVTGVPQPRRTPIAVRMTIR